MEFQSPQIHDADGESGRETEKPFASDSPVSQIKRQSFREEMVFAKGHANTEIGTAANYGCQIQVGYHKLSIHHLL